MPRVVVIGSTNVDLTFSVPRLPRPGETRAGTAFDLGHGGKGANQAVMAARLGAAVSFLSAVGDDSFGAAATENLRHYGVPTDLVRVVPGPTGTAAIFVDAQANNVIVVVAGANGRLTPDDARAARPHIEAADVVVAQLETPADATREAFAIARAAGVTTLLNPAPVVPGVAELLPLADLCVPNETELEALTGVADLDRALDALLALGPTGVLVTLGRAGSRFRDGTRDLTQEPFAVTAVDPTAAGDAYIGSLAVSLASRESLTDAMRRASAVAALTVTKPGAQRAFPSPAEVAEVLARR